MAESRIRDPDGRVALVTGGASGIGAAVVERLATDGVRVASFDLRPSPTADLSLDRDVPSTERLRGGVAKVEEALGPIDVLVCAAGVFGGAVPTAEVSDELWERVFAVNAGGTHKAIREVIPGMKAR